MTGADVDRPVAARSLPDRLWVPALLAALLALSFVGALLVRAHGDPSLLVHAAPPWSDAAGARQSLTVQPDVEDGFDGQFFYRLGVAPWSTDTTVDGVTFDLPSLRNARWGYGALAFLASAGDPDLVPWALIGLNVIAAVAVGAIGGALARSSGRHAAWGAVLFLWPGFAYSLSLDTSELVASAFLLGGLLALRHRRWASGALLFTAAVLTRDTTAAIPFGVALAGAWTWWDTRRPAPNQTEDPVAVAVGHPDKGERAAAIDLATAGLVALFAFGSWQMLQRHRFGTLPLTSSGDKNLSGPLGGLVDLLRTVVPPSSGEEAFRLLSVAGLLGLIGLAAWSWRRSATPLAERVAWLPAVAVVVLLNAYLWSGATAFMRASTEAGLLSILVIVGSPRRWLFPLASAGLAGLWLLTAAAQLSKLG